MFVLQPKMLMIDASILDIIWIIFTAITGMVAIGAGVIGFWYRGLNWIERIISIIAGLLLVFPEGGTDIVGLVIFILIVIYQFTIGKGKDKGRGPGTSTEVSV